VNFNNTNKSVGRTSTSAPDLQVRPPGPRLAGAPLAGTAYDFRNLFPGLVPPVVTPAPKPAPAQAVRPAQAAATTRRAMFSLLRGARPKQ